jgi:hypothetical protein
LIHSTIKWDFIVLPPFHTLKSSLFWSSSKTAFTFTGYVPTTTKLELCPIITTTTTTTTTAAAAADAAAINLSYIYPRRSKQKPSLALCC